MRLLLLLLLALLLVQQLTAQSRAGANTAISRLDANVLAQTIAHVGARTITRQHIEWRMAIERAYGGTITREAALASIINDALEHEVARTIGVVADTLEMQRFSGHADATSKAPEILAVVKSIFGADTSSYLLQYLSPRLNNQKLHNYFVSDTSNNTAKRRAIEHAYALAAGGARIAIAAADANLEYRCDTVMVVREMSALEPGIPHDAFQQMIAKLEPGQLYKSIVESDYDYSVVRLASRNDSMQIVEVISARKATFDELLRAHESVVEVRIDDPEIRDAMLLRYPKVWWNR